MPVGVLVQAPKDNVRSSYADPKSTITSLESTIETISIRREASFGRTSSAGGEFHFDVEMAESSRTQNSLNVKFSLRFGRPSSGQLCEIVGRAAFHFPRLDPNSDLNVLGTEINNEMAVGIFRKHYDLIYLIHATMGLEAPSPWVTQNVSLSSRSQGLA